MLIFVWICGVTEVLFSKFIYNAHVTSYPSIICGHILRLRVY